MLLLDSLDRVWSLWDYIFTLRRPFLIKSPIFGHFGRCLEKGSFRGGYAGVRKSGLFCPFLMFLRSLIFFMDSLISIIDSSCCLWSLWYYFLYLGVLSYEKVLFLAILADASKRGHLGGVGWGSEKWSFLCFFLFLRS